MLSVLVVVAMCMNGASPVSFVLSLFYLCAIQMNPMCVVCAQKTESGPYLWGQGCVDTICTDVCSILTSCRLCLTGTSNHC